MTDEARLQADIESLRPRFPDTQDLYREVCTVLFFRYGITPTANKLYQYIRKGSMSAPAEALAKFWEDLREKSRVRIEHPDLPDTLKSAAGELVAALWTQAQSAAQDGLEIFRSEAQATVLEAQTAQASAENVQATTLLERDQAQQATMAATERIQYLERDLAVERASRETLASQLATAKRQQVAIEATLAETRRDYAAELEKHRAALERTEERFEASEKRALLEIDRERTTAVKLQKDLIQSRQSLQDAEERHRTEVAQIQAALGDAQQKSGLTEGMLRELRMQCQQQTDELKLLRKTFAEGEARKGLLEHELATCRENVSRLERKLQESLTVAAPEGDPIKPRKRSQRTVA